MRRLSFVLLVAAPLLSACPSPKNVECRDNSSCDLFGGGQCLATTTGNQWCAYPDAACPSGYRFSDQDVGDGVAGQCTDPTVGPTQFTLTVQLAGSGMGGVSSEPDGLTCASGTCTGTFDAGTVVQLTATATTGAFLGWSDGCSGQGSCAVMMDRARSVSALFGTPGQALWSTQVGGAGEDFGFGTAVDSQGNVLAVGRFAQSMTVGTTTLTSAGGFDMYVVKLDGTSGDVVWAKKFGGASDDAAYSVAVDASDNVYVSGEFSGSIDFGTGAMTSAGASDVFVAKLNSSGDAQWSRRYGGTSADSQAGLAVRGSAVVVALNFLGSVTVGTGTLTSAGSFDLLIVSHDLSGTISWAKRYGGTDTEVGAGLAIDADDNVVLGGRFRGSADFGGGSLTSAGGFDVLLLKVNGTSGTHLMSRRFGSSGFETAAGVAVDGSKNVILLGSFIGTVDFGAGPVTSSQTANADVFLAKYSIAGACQWAKAFGGTGTVQGRQGTGVAVNGAGDIAITGYFDGSITFGGSTLSSANTNSTDLFAARFAGTDGSHLNSVRAGGTSTEEGRGIAQASDGRFFVTGEFNGFADFGGEALTSNGGNDAFVLALAPL